MIIAETERLILRDWRHEDLATFVRHCNTPAVMRWLGGVQATYIMPRLSRHRRFAEAVQREPALPPSTASSNDPCI